MNALSRTELPAPVKAHLAASAISGQGQHGALSDLARQYDVSRPTIYAVGSEAKEVLEGHFNNASSGSVSKWKPVQVCVDLSQLVRAVAALRAVSPNSIRCIEDLIPILYPNVRLGYGTVQAIAAEVEARAAAFNAKASALSGITDAALDEMFSQGDPVLAGVDLDSGYLFSLALREGRSGDDWKQVLEQAKEQGLKLEVVVKDAAKGIAAGVSAVFRDAEQRDDCFHALYEMNKVRGLLERRAYGAIQRESDAKEALSKARRSVDGKRAKLAQRLRWASVEANKAIALHDEFERATRAAAEAMELVSLETGLVRQPEQMQQEIEAAAAQMVALDNARCKKVGRYLRNRAPGLALHLHPVNEAFALTAERYGEAAVKEACLVHRLATDLQKDRRPWDTSSDKRRLREAIDALERSAPEQAERVLGLVDVIVQKRHRASSAVEGFNAALRPFLYVHKGTTQGFLELFRAHHNLKTRRWGRHKGTSAHEVLTGERINDWLTVLGYPPSPTLN